MKKKPEPIEDFYARVAVAWERDVAAGLYAAPLTLPDPDHHPEAHDAALVAHLITYAQRRGHDRALELSAALRKHGTTGMDERFKKRHPDLPTSQDIERWAFPPAITVAPNTPTRRLLDLG